MTYEQALKLEDRQLSGGRRNMATAYCFLILSAVFFAVFFLKVRELPLAGCAFLCDAAGVVYLLRALPSVCPFRQAQLAARCAASPSEENVCALCAALEKAGKKARYGKGPRERFEEARLACRDLPEEARSMLDAHLKAYGGPA